MIDAERCKEKLKNKDPECIKRLQEGKCGLKKILEHCHD